MGWSALIWADAWADRTGQVAAGAEPDRDLKRVFFPYDITAMGVPLAGHDGKVEHVFVTPALVNVDDDAEPEKPVRLAG